MRIVITLFITTLLQIPTVLSYGIIQHKFTTSSDVTVRYIRSENVRNKIPISLNLLSGKTTIIDLPYVKYSRSYSFKIQILKINQQEIGKFEQSIILENDGQWINNTFWYPGVGLNIQTLFSCSDTFYGPRCDQHCDTSSISNSSRLRCDNNGNLRCDYGWMGPQCTQVVDPRECGCSPRGVCVSSGVHNTSRSIDERLVCECHVDFMGDKCEISKIDGLLAPRSESCDQRDVCLNGAQCVPNGPQSFCVCAAGFAGQFCEVAIVDSKLFYHVTAMLVLLAILLALLVYKWRATTPDTNLPLPLLTAKNPPVVYTIKRTCEEQEQDDEQRYTTAPSIRNSIVRCDSENYATIFKPSL